MSDRCNHNGVCEHPAGTACTAITCPGRQRPQPTAGGASSASAVPASAVAPPSVALAVDDHSRLRRVSGFSGFAVENAFCTSEAGRTAVDPVAYSQPSGEQHPAQATEAGRAAREPAVLPARLGSSTVLNARPFATALAKANSPAVHVRTQDGGPFGGLHD